MSWQSGDCVINYLLRILEETVIEGWRFPVSADTLLHVIILIDSQPADGWKGQLKKWDDLGVNDIRSLTVAALLNVHRF